MDTIQNERFVYLVLDPNVTFVKLTLTYSIYLATNILMRYCNGLLEYAVS